MFNEILGSEYIVTQDGTSEGTQIKYRKRDFRISSKGIRKKEIKKVQSKIQEKYCLKLVKRQQKNLIFDCTF